ncbi:GIY-YIG nuclease family protein [Actinomadura welshii]|uniref:GIY-YIG nuclease family protein n=1 Tax=Actinomadura welshii TaxID=3103817 RepID=UPI003B8A8B3B
MFETRTRSDLIPTASGVYRWRFTVVLSSELPTAQLLYIGISPRRMPRRRSQHLRMRIRCHYRGNACGSTLRFSLGCLLGLELRQIAAADA